MIARLCLPLCLIPLILSLPALGAPDTKLTLTPDMVVNESGLGNASALVDEQTVAGDPASGHGGQPAKAWSPDWPGWHYPASAFLDLGVRCHVSQVYLYGGQALGHVTVASGSPFHWTPLFSGKEPGEDHWQGHLADVSTRYLRITLEDGGSKLPEIVLYGSPQEKARPLPTLHKHVLPTMDQLIGVNAFIDDPLDKMAVFGFVREYHDWSWDGASQDANQWNPSAAGGGGWNFDDYYGKLKAQGATVSPCVQQSVPWLTGGDWAKSDDKPIPAASDPADPHSYALHAQHLFQLAARYGSAILPDTQLKLASNQPRKSGLGLLRYYENWNEEDKTWKGQAAFFTPYQFAAMCSADYDGDQGRMGGTDGVKNADPRAKLVMGGAAGLSLGYVKAMKAWADANRGGNFPADVLNFHHYSNDGGEQESLGTVGISPEADRLREKVQALADYRDHNLPSLELWVTEFGYDTSPKSPQRAPAIGPYSQEEVQGQWLIRSYLALAATGVDRAAAYMLRDVNPNDATQFSTSGLVTQKGEWKPKPAWFYAATLKTRLTGMRFAGDVSTGRPDVRIYKFRHGADAAGAYVVWCPTSEAKTISDYRLSLPPRVTSATLVTLTAGQQNGAAAPLPLQGHVAVLAVSELPVIVLVNDVL